MKNLLVAFLLITVHAAANGSEADEKLILATYKIANEKSTATCLAVSRPGKEETATERFLVTADHVFEQMAGNHCTLVSRTPRKDGTYGRKEIRIEIRKNGQGNLWKKHPGHDLAVLRLPDNIAIEALPLDCLATGEALKKIHSGDSVRLAVFPEQSEANGAGFPILRNGTIASFPLNPAKHHPIFLVDATAWTGDSGGPVIHETARSADGNPLVIGLVHGMRNITDTVKDSRFTERKRHYPLGIVEVMQASFVWDLFDEIED